MQETLEKLGRKIGDVMVDDIGSYVLAEEDNGSPSDDGYIISFKKIYLEKGKENKSTLEPR